MLKKLEDYTFLKDYIVSHGLSGSITGNVLPVLDLMQQLAPISIEDQIFIVEMALERGITYPKSATIYLTDESLPFSSVERLYETFSFAKPDDDDYFQAFTSDSETDVKTAYRDKFFTPKDLHIEKITSDNPQLDRDLIRKYYYDLNRLSRGITFWGSYYIYAPVFLRSEGLFSFDVHEGWTDEQGVYQTGEFKYNALLRNEYSSIFPESERVNLTHGGIYWNAHLYIFQNVYKAYEDISGADFNHYESKWNGDFFAVNEDADEKAKPKWMLVQFSVKDVYIPSVSESNTTTRYVWMAFGPAVENAPRTIGGREYARVVSFPFNVPHRNIVKAAFPNAVFTPLSSRGNHEYTVDIVSAEIVVDYDYKSEVTSTGWTWKPKEIPSN